ncbi:MAG: dihydrolipoamide acetyltransferase family protein [Caldilineaceae bacterium]
MAFEVRMPTFGLTEGEATIIRWLKAVGDTVQADEPLFETENEKATLEVPAPQDGVLLRILVAAGQRAALQALVAWIGAPGEQLSTGQQGNGAARTVADEPVAAATQPDLPATPAERLKSSPIARRLAREHGIDLSVVRGSGPNGRIVEADIQAILKARAEAAAPSLPTASAVAPPKPEHVVASATAEVDSELLPLTAVRRITAERLTASARATVSVPLFMDVDMSEAQRLREATRAEYTQRFGAACSYNALVLCAIARTLPQFPALNGQWTEKGVRAIRAINIGLAMQMEEGLLVPAIQQADRKTLIELQAEIGQLIDLARSRQLTPAQLTSGTFTMTNLGNVGIDAFVPVINLPQTAILGVGRIGERVVALNGQPTVRPQATLCLVFDHRAMDGAPAAACLARVKQLLENPYLLI